MPAYRQRRRRPQFPRPRSRRGSARAASRSPANTCTWLCCAGSTRRTITSRWGIPGRTCPARYCRWSQSHKAEPVCNPRQALSSALVQAVLRAGEHGLDPDLFHAAALKDPAALPPIDRDLLLSDAFLGYADALARGAVPVELRMDDAG